MNTEQRIRGHKLQRIRRGHLSEQPLCVACYSKGQIKAATELDHIVALMNGGSNEPSNLQGLCTECHKVKTAADKGHRARVTIGVDGWPVLSC